MNQPHDAEKRRGWVATTHPLVARGLTVTYVWYQHLSSLSQWLNMLRTGRIRGFAFMRYINPRLIDWLIDWLQNLHYSMTWRHRSFEKQRSVCKSWKTRGYDSAMDCLILPKFGMWEHYGTSEAVQWLKSRYHEIHDWRWTTNFRSLNCYNSATDCWFSLKLGMWVHYGSTKAAQL